jgi:hypothetical protein
MIRSLPLPRLDLDRLPLDRMAGLPRPTLPRPTLPRPTLDSDDLARVGRVAEDAAYIAVGLGILGVQRLQVRRREIMRAVQRRT